MTLYPRNKGICVQTLLMVGVLTYECVVVVFVIWFTFLFQGGNILQQATGPHLMIVEPHSD